MRASVVGHYFFTFGNIICMICAAALLLAPILTVSRLGSTADEKAKDLSFLKANATDDIIQTTWGLWGICVKFDMSFIEEFASSLLSDVESVADLVTSDAASVASKATSGAASVASDVTSGGSSVANDVTSGGASVGKDATSALGGITNAINLRRSEDDGSYDDFAGPTSTAAEFYARAMLPTAVPTAWHEFQKRSLSSDWKCSGPNTGLSFPTLDTSDATSNIAEEAVSKVVSGAVSAVGDIEKALEALAAISKVLPLITVFALVCAASTAVVLFLEFCITHPYFTFWLLGLEFLTLLFNTLALAFNAYLFKTIAKELKKIELMSKIEMGNTALGCQGAAFGLVCIGVLIHISNMITMRSIRHGNKARMQDSGLSKLREEDSSSALVVEDEGNRWEEKLWGRKRKGY